LKLSITVGSYDFEPRVVHAIRDIVPSVVAIWKKSTNFVAVVPTITPDMTNQPIPDEHFSVEYCEIGNRKLQVGDLLWHDPSYRAR